MPCPVISRYNTAGKQWRKWPAWGFIGWQENCSRMVKKFSSLQVRDGHTERHMRDPKIEVHGWKF